MSCDNMTCECDRHYTSVMPYDSCDIILSPNSS